MGQDSKKVKAKKSLGQHFLRSKDAIKKIIAAAEIVPGETVLEIGPGRGVLTDALLLAGARVGEVGLLLPARGRGLQIGELLATHRGRAARAAVRRNKTNRHGRQS